MIDALQRAHYVRTRRRRRRGPGHALGCDKNLVAEGRAGCVIALQEALADERREAAPGPDARQMRRGEGRRTATRTYDFQRVVDEAPANPVYGAEYRVALEQLPARTAAHA